MRKDIDKGKMNKEEKTTIELTIRNIEIYLNEQEAIHILLLLILIR